MIKTSSSCRTSESKSPRSVLNMAAKTSFEYALRDPEIPMSSGRSWPKNTTKWVTFSVS